jgi:NitT/TauT family transport system substrate-binding protein
VLLAAELGQNGLKGSDQPGKDVQIIYLGYPDLNQALLQKQVDAIMQTEPQSSQAIARGFGVEVVKPYDTPVGSPIRTLVMSEKFYKDNRALAAKFMACFVKAQKTFIDEPQTAEQFVTQVLFKGQVSGDEFKDAIRNSPYSIEMSAEHIQKVTDIMAKYGVGKMAKPANATDWVKVDLLEEAKAAAGVK